MPRRTLSHVLRAAPVKALVATGFASAAAGLLLAFPPTASAAAAGSTSGNLVLPSHGPFPTIGRPTSPKSPTAKSPVTKTTTTAAHRRKSSPPASPRGSQQPAFNYVSTFSPAPVVLNTPNSSATVSCLANTQPLTGSGGDLDLPGIPGSSKDPGHAGALPIGSMGPTTMLPPQVDSASLTQLQIVRSVDAASTNLSMIASSGYRFPCIHVEFGTGNGYSNVQYALVNAGLVSDDRSGKSETLTWTYSTILWSYSLPGSTKVHQGAGQINAQPNVVTKSVAQDTRVIALGTIGLTAVVAFALILLYVMGLRRNRKRYRQRYYRRASLRAEREAMMVAVEAAQAAQAAEAARWMEVAAREAEAREAEERRRAAAEAEREAAAPADADVDADVDAELEAESEPESISAQAEQHEAETEESDAEAEDDEPASEAEAEAETDVEVESKSEPESEVEDEPAAEPEPELTAEPEPEPEPEPESAAEVEEPEPEPESAAEAEAEPESVVRDSGSDERDEEQDSEQDAESSESAGYRKTPV